MFLGDDVELVSREDSMELLDLFDPTGTQEEACSLLEFAG